MTRDRKKDLGKANKSRRKKLTAHALTPKVSFGFWHQDRVNYKANKLSVLIE